MEAAGLLSARASSSILPYLLVLSLSKLLEAKSVGGAITFSPVVTMAGSAAGAGVGADAGVGAGISFDLSSETGSTLASGVVSALAMVRLASASLSSSRSEDSPASLAVASSDLVFSELALVSLDFAEASVASEFSSVWLTLKLSFPSCSVGSVSSVAGLLAGEL